MNIFDLHSDLLSFLAENPSHSIYSPESLCSYPQMQQGRVALQILAIYSPVTDFNPQKAKDQVDAYFNLLNTHKDKYSLWNPAEFGKTPHIQILPSIENAAALCKTNEGAKEAILFLEKNLKQIAYISLTWNEENQFGGGNDSTTGLKQAGKELLLWMNERSIPIDFSHTSDALAQDILNFIDKKSLTLPILASHSNMRYVTNQKRNLPDEFVREIISRKGLIGLNLFAPFIGSSFSRIKDHILHLISMGGNDCLSFGADFFPISIFSHLLEKYQINTAFFPESSNVSCYPQILEFLSNEAAIDLSALAYKNALRFFTAHVAKGEMLSAAFQNQEAKDQFLTENH